MRSRYTPVPVSRVAPVTVLDAGSAFEICTG